MCTSHAVFFYRGRLFKTGYLMFPNEMNYTNTFRIGLENRFTTENWSIT